MLEPSYKPKELEEKVRVYWDKNNIRRRVEEREDQKEVVGYVEGPPTLNGEPHIGHVRGRFYKDLWFRYATLSGKKVIFRGGWDTQGLPVELQAAKELGITGEKQELIKIGMEKLVEKAKEMIKTYYASWISSDRLLGLMMDHEKDYWTYRDEYIEREWQILKAAWEERLLGESYRVVGYCPHCQTALSHSEVSSEYELLEDPSLYYKAKLRDHENRYIVLWTTMPFTLITDVMVGANPDASYSIVEVGNEEWVIASNRVADLMNELGIADYKVKGNVLGVDLKGKRYYYPLAEEVPKQKEYDEKFKTHVMVLDQSVDISTGSGLVHMAPANGEIDFNIAQREGLPIFNPFDDSVHFTQEAGKYAGIFARDTDFIVIEDLRKKGLVIKASKIIHEYPTCWRSHHRLVWLARREYFYWVDKVGDKALKAAEGVEYFFEAPKNRFLNIIREMKPWCISRERVWGTPLPIWTCSQCGEKNALFSRKEIVQNALELPDGPNFELHRPWVDRITIKCKKCGGKAFRESFVLDTWHNSGASQYAAFTDEEYRRYVPVEFLTEGIDQTRGWAYSLLILSVIFNKAPKSCYKAFLFQGHILGPDEAKMSKSLGNIIDGNETLSQYPVDAIRFYFAWKVSPIATLVFKPNEILERPFQVLNTLYHLHVYLQQNSVLDGFNDKKHNLIWAQKEGKLNFLDEWILSRSQRITEETIKSYSKSEFNEAAKTLEKFIIEEISQKYVPAIRRELWSDDPSTLDRRLTIYSVLSYCLKKADILLHPICPFITDCLYLECFTDRKDSILFESFPEVDEKLLNDLVERKFTLVDRMISTANALRMKAKLKRRWPVRETVFIIPTTEDFTEQEIRVLKDLINTKQLTIATDLASAPTKYNLKPNVEKLGKRLRKDLPKLFTFLERTDRDTLAEELIAKKKVELEIEGIKLILHEEDFQFIIEPKEGYDLLESDGIKVLMKVSRESDLIKEGTIRDVARRIQAYRKEIGLNPTYVVKSVILWSDDNEIIETVREKVEELKFLVRTENIETVERCDEDWKEEEIDGKRLMIKIVI
ncbi:MAG: isoleucine--tRNA ligase [Nitrososphaeria archaeon]